MDEDPFMKYAPGYIQTTPPNEIALLVMKTRIEKKLSKRKLAMMMGITPQHIGYIESGKVTPSLGVLYHMARVLGMNLVVTLTPKEFPGEKV